MGADVNAQGGTFGNALQVASFRGHYDVVKLLLENGADVHLQIGCPGSALHAASFGGYKDVVQMILDKAPDFPTDVKSHQSGRTALSFAAERGHESVVRLLLTRPNVDDSSADNMRRTPIFYASKEGRINVVKCLLVTNPGTVDCIDHYGSSPLSVAAR